MGVLGGFPWDNILSALSKNKLKSKMGLVENKNIIHQLTGLRIPGSNFLIF